MDATRPPHLTKQLLQRAYFVLLPVLVILDPRVMLRTLLGDMGDPIGIALGSIFGLISVYLALSAQSKHVRKYSVALLAFSVFTVIRYISAESRWTNTAQVAFPYVAAWVAIGHLRVSGFIERIAWGFAIALLINAAIVLVPGDFVVRGLDAQTAYGVSQSGSTSLFGNRATGFLSAPGFLSLHATLGLAIGLCLTLSARWRFGLLMLVPSIVCGLATANRSFLIGAAIAAAAFPLTQKRISRGVLTLLLALPFLGGVAYYLWTDTGYGQVVARRLEDDTLSADIEKRLHGRTGSIDALEAITENPVWGALAFDEFTGAGGVASGQELYQPHNSIVWLCSSRGVVGGALFLWLYAVAIYRAWSNMRSAAAGPTLSSRAPAGALFLALVSGTAVCMVDPVLESGPMLLLIAIGLGLGAPGADDRTQGPGERPRSLLVGEFASNVGSAPSGGPGHSERCHSPLVC